MEGCPKGTKKRHLKKSFSSKIGLTIILKNAWTISIADNFFLLTNLNLKTSFQFALRIFLEQSLQYIDKLPHDNFDQVAYKYADMNIAHPFCGGNG